MGKREQIISTAINLFNENRSTNVSTNHIAAQLGISPGNVYYYFKDKEHIIRVIWEEISSKMDSMFFDPELGRSEFGIVQFYIRIAQYTHQFRFFYLEINVLLANDPELRGVYVDRASKIMKHLEVIVDSWMSLGIMNQINENDKKWLVENSWTLGQLWVTRADILNTYHTLQEGVADEMWHIYALSKPYFSDEANEKIQKLLLEEKFVLKERVKDTKFS